MISAHPAIRVRPLINKIKFKNIVKVIFFIAIVFKTCQIVLKTRWTFNTQRWKVVDITNFGDIILTDENEICNDNYTVFWIEKSKQRSRFESDIIAYNIRTIDKLVRANRLLNLQQLVVMYNLESPAHTYSTKQYYDFAITYDWQTSFPFPYTYFHNTETYLKALLKEQIPRNNGVVWLCSNCDGYNQRHIVVKELMKYLPIDSFGACLRNVNISGYNGDPIELYKQYKYVIAIENSNCIRYVTEKFKMAIEAGSVPIVAGFDNKPNYLQFAPKGSYVNIYDFNDLRIFAKYIRESLHNNELYIQRHFGYKRKEDPEIFKMKPTELLEWCKSTRYNNMDFSKHLLTWENGQSLYCKLHSYMKNISYDKRTISNIRWHLRNASKVAEKHYNYQERCLSRTHLVDHFNL